MFERSWRRSTPRAALATLLLAVLVFFGLRPVYARFLVADREAWARRLDAVTQHHAPGYDDLLLEADARIPRGARVAIVYPTLEWGPYSFAYFRAQYLLAGRVVVPLSWTDGPRGWRIDEVEYVVAYRTSPQRGDWSLLFENRDGAVQRREK